MNNITQKQLVLPSDLMPNVQKISNYMFFMLLEKVLGQPLSNGERRHFQGCRCVEDFMAVLIESPIYRKLAVEGNPIGQWKLGELYTCLRCDMRWEPRSGFDLWGALEYQKMITAGRVEVKTGGIIQSSDWIVQITGRKKVLIADVLVFVGMVDSYNPCDSVLLAIPKEILEPEVDRQLRKRDRIPYISINKCRFSKKTRRMNKWYEFEVYDHSQLRQYIAQYVHGDFQIIPQQLILF